MPQVDLANNPKCLSCLEIDPGNEEETIATARRRSVVRSRASVDLRKRSSLVGRARAQTNASFEELMSRIKLQEGTKSAKSETCSLGRASPSPSHSLSPSRATSPQLLSVNSNALSQPMKHGADNTSVGEKNQEDAGGEKALPYRAKPDKCTRLIGTGEDRDLSSDSSDVHLPSDYPPYRLGRRRSTPQTWRVPSTKYEAEELDLTEDESSPRKHSTVAPVATTKEHKISWSKPGMVKSTSSGNLPGMFSKRGGRALQLNLGGTKKCAGCLKSVFPMEQTAGPNGTSFHKACLRCARCRKAMDSSSKFIEEKPDHSIDIYCRTCWDSSRRN